MRAAELLDRARRRCAAHRNVPGVCRQCLLWEFEAMLLEEHPEMTRGQAHEFVQEWVLAGDNPDS